MEENQEVMVSVGGLELVLEMEKSDGEIEWRPLPISKMRSWRVGVLVSTVHVYMYIHHLLSSSSSPSSPVSHTATLYISGV